MKWRFGIAFLMLATFSYSQTTKKVFFIGNSYTSANNLPSLVSSLAVEDGNALSYDSETPGGVTFSGHAVSSTVLNKIASEDWDYVVLQEQSQAPSFPDGQVQSDVYPFAEVLVDSIYANNECSIPLFYGTWGREIGDSQWVGINTFEKMNTRLFNAYTYMANQAEGMMSPVGIGFAHIKQDGNATVTFNDLYTSDGSHPTIKGSYLAACIFNNIIFNGTSTGNTFLPAGVNTSEAEYLQGVADHVVYAVDSVQIDFRPTLPVNTFTISGTEATVTFTSDIQGGNFESWDFGDGQTSTQANATHTYTSNGVYDVIMYSTVMCQLDSVIKQVTISTLGIVSEEINVFNVYPNPSTDGIVNIELSTNEEYTVYSIMGNKVYVGQAKELRLNKGIYSVRFKNQTRKIIVL